MRFNAGSVVVAAAGSQVNAGSLVGTGVDWSPTFEPYLTCAINAGLVTAAGSVVADLQGSNALASNYVSLGSVAFAGAPAGTQTYQINATNPYRYTRIAASVAAGSAVLSASFIGKPRTTTS